MRILTVYAHPSPKSFCHAILQQFTLVLLCQFDAVYLGAWTNHLRSPMCPVNPYQN